MTEPRTNNKFLPFLCLTSVALRILFIPLVDLLPEEAYYWNYSQHLAPGYLDHPPFSAWLIALGSLLFGYNELAVRIGAILTSTVACFFVFKLSALISNRSLAWLSVCIFTLLPYYIGNSFYLSPDAGLVAAWAASLYFMTSIIVKTEDSKQQNLNWLFLGIAIGIGLLSKYTISLLAISGFFVFALDKKLHFWFRKPAPYFALAISLIIFSPVIYWNATHEWASFVFQSTRRFSEESRFALFDFIGHILVVGTPPGVIIALIFACTKNKQNQIFPGISVSVVRLLQLSFLIPTIIFLLSSIQHQPRLNWSGPGFLSILPIFATFLSNKISFLGSYNNLLRRLTLIFLTLSPILYVLFWIYCSFGIPFVPYKASVNKLIGWEYLGMSLADLRQQSIIKNGQDPLIIGMDKHYTAAELSFYMRKALPFADAPLIAGRSLFGYDDLMFSLWAPKIDLNGKSAILVARSKSDLEFPEITKQFTNLEEIHELQSFQNGKAAGKYFYRQAFGFIPRK